MPGYLTSPVQFSSLPYGMMPQKGSTIQTFRFQPRRDGIDWRRFSAIDIERVARELDISTLQESINSITFCNLDGEKCPYCQQPVDPVLLKVLKMAQLIIEYLLHCQESLSSSVAQLEERLAEAAGEHQQTKDELIKQGEEMKKVKEESKRRKKMIETQQMLLQAGANNYHKCQLCDKAFMNYSYLQGHLQRRHPEITETERQKKKQVEHIEDGIEELKSKLQKTQSQLEEERELGHKRRMQEVEEAHRWEENMKRDIERWKEEERSKFHNEMDKMRELFLSQLQDITLKSSTYESRFHDLETKKSMISNLGHLINEEDHQERQKMQDELKNLRDEMTHQQTEWKKKMKELQRQHNMDKQELLYENDRLKASMSNDQRSVDQQLARQMQSLKSEIKEKKRLIKSQKQMIDDLSRSREVPQVPQVVLPVGRANEDADGDESAAELSESLDHTLKKIEDLRRNPQFIRQFRPILEETLIEKLESMGVKKGAKGVSSSTHKSLKALLATQLEQKMRKYPEIQATRAKLSKALTARVKQWRKNEDAFQYSPSKLTGHSVRSTHSVPPSDKTTQKDKNVLMVGSYQIHNKAPVPSPRTKVTGRQNTTGAPQAPPRTPPFTSEEESSMIGQSSFHLHSQKEIQDTQPNSRVQMLAQAEEEDSDEWSDFDISPEKPSPRSVTFSTKQGSFVHAMAQGLEKQLSRPRQKPVGGVETVRSQPIKSLTKQKVAGKLQLSDLSDSDISSLEEVTEQLDLNEKKPQPAVRHSADSTGSQGTSVWSSTSIRAAGW
ncbi:cilium assembly protein DZIP1L [Rhinophrynus dorsalis]